MSTLHEIHLSVAAAAVSDMNDIKDTWMTIFCSDCSILREDSSSPAKIIYPGNRVGILAIEAMMSGQEVYHIPAPRIRRTSTAMAVICARLCLS